VGSGPGWAPDQVHLQCISPVLHARADALVAGRGRRVLHGELAQAAGHHGHGAELALGAGTVGVLPVEPVLRAAAHGPVVRADERHLHGRAGNPAKYGSHNKLQNTCGPSLCATPERP